MYVIDRKIYIVYCRGGGSEMRVIMMQHFFLPPIPHRGVCMTIAKFVHCICSRMVKLHYTLLQRKVMLLVWNFSFPLLVSM